MANESKTHEATCGTEVVTGHFGKYTYTAPCKREPNHEGPCAYARCTYGPGPCDGQYHYAGVAHFPETCGAWVPARRAVA